MLFELKILYEKGSIRNYKGLLLCILTTNWVLCCTLFAGQNHLLQKRNTRRNNRNLCTVTAWDLRPKPFH